MPMGPSIPHAVPGPSSARGVLDAALLPGALIALGLGIGFAGPLGEALRTLRLPDTDDAMRLAQVRDLVAGQAWFDPVQHRFLPPGGAASHWSRLVDAPLAAAIAALTPLVGPGLAERLVTALWPPLLFAAYATVLLRGMGSLFGRRAALLALFSATQTIVLISLFAPGRIDHHNVQVVVMLGVCLSLIRPRPTLRSGAVAGGWCALSLAVGLEALPLVALAGLVAAADWIRTGRTALPVLLGFGLSLGLGAAVLFGLQTAPALWTQSACDALSPPWLWIGGIGAALALAAASLRPERATTRLALTMAVGSIGIAGFTLLFPSCLQGPFSGLPEDLRLRWLSRVGEMQPFTAMLRERPGEALGLAAALFAAAPAAFALAGWGPIRNDPERRRACLIVAAFLALGSVSALFQVRGAYVASAFVPVIAGLYLDRALTVPGSDAAGGRARAAFLIAALALNAHAWLAAGQLVERVAGLDAQAQGPGGRLDACAKASGLTALDGLPPGTVLAPIDLGPYLLVHTRHAVVAAPYHRAVPGLVAGLALLDGDEAELRRQTGLTGAQYLALCPNREPAADKAAASFADRLAHGEVGASWLEPLVVPGTALRLWRIR